MADYTDQDVNSLLPGEPWTSAKALAAFENPIAIAEGAAGAPRNEPLSLSLLIGGQSFALGIPREYLGLAGVQSLLVVGSVTGSMFGPDPVPQTLQVSFSLDNGGTWGAWTAFLSVLGDITIGATKHVHLGEGRVDTVLVDGAAGANAVRFRKATSTGSARIMVLGLGRT